MKDTLQLDDKRLSREQRLEREQSLEIILESDGKKIVEITALIGTNIGDHGFLIVPLRLSSIKASPEAGELLGSAIDLFKNRFDSLYYRLIKIGETLFPDNYSIRTEIKPYQR